MMVCHLELRPHVLLVISLSPSHPPRFILSYYKNNLRLVHWRDRWPSYPSHWRQQLVKSQTLQGGTDIVTESR